MVVVNACGEVELDRISACTTVLVDELNRSNHDFGVYGEGKKTRWAKVHVSKYEGNSTWELRERITSQRVDDRLEASQRHNSFSLAENETSTGNLEPIVNAPQLPLPLA